MQDDEFDSLKFFELVLRQSVARGAYFETSSNRVLTPVEALEEAHEALEAFNSEPEQTWQAVPFALNRVSLSFASSTLHREILAVSSASQLKRHIDTFFSLYESSTSSKKSLVNQRTPALRQRLEVATKDISAMYEKKLVERAVDALSPDRSYSSNRDKIFKVVPELATYLNYQGRDVESLANDVQALLDDCKKRTVPEALSEVERLLKSTKNDFAVATVITGAVNAEIPPELEGKRILFPGPVSWGKSKSRGARRRRGAGKSSDTRYPDSDLAKFCMEHWKVDAEQSNCEHQVSAQVIVWEVKAWDYVQARQIALDKSESMMDLINAEHRVGEFGVKRKVLIWKRGEKHTRYLSDVYEATRHTRVMKAHSSPSVQRSLRFASRSSTERAGAMAVLFGWAALEYLGRGNRIVVQNKPMTPQNFIAKFLPKVVGLAALHHLANEAAFAISSQTSIRELPSELNQILRLRGKPAHFEHMDQRHLFHLLAASRQSKEVDFDELAEKLRTTREKAEVAFEQFVDLIQLEDPIGRYRVRAISKLLLSPESMAQYLAKVEKDADVALQRMRYVRNQTAHSTIPESLRYRTLSSAMKEILDTCYQAIDKNSTSLSPHEAIHELSREFDNLLGELHSGNMEQVFAPHLALFVREQ